MYIVKILGLISLFLLTSFVLELDAQITIESVDTVLERMEAEIEEQVVLERKLAGQLRADMNELIESTELIRSMIVGRDDKYIKEGMHANFRSAPGSMLVRHDRDRRVISLEDKHVELYHSDRRLHMCMELKDEVAQLKNNRMAKKALFLQLTSDSSTNAMIESHVLQDFTMVSQLKPRVPKHRRSFKSDLITIKRENPIDYKAHARLSECMIASYPYDGQANFYIDEDIGRTGYFLLDRDPWRVFENLNQNKQQLLIRWTSADQEVFFTKTTYDRLVKVIYFHLRPDLLDLNTIYKFELVKCRYDMPDEQYADSYTLEHYLGLKTRELRGCADLSEEDIEFTGYMRTSSYRELEDKLNDAQIGEYQEHSDSRIINLREPFSRSEISMDSLGNSIVSLNVSYLDRKNKEVLTHRDLFYFLTVPTIEEIDTTQYEQKLIADYDNTINTLFVEQLKLGAPRKYESFKDYRGDTIVSDIEIKDHRVGNHLDVDWDNILEPVNQEHFLKNEYKVAKSTRVKFEYPYVAKLDQYRSSLKELLLERIDDRANYFYMLDIVKRKRSGDAKRLTPDFFRNREHQYLPDVVKEVLDGAYDPANDYDPSLLISNSLPGLKLKTTERTFFDE